MNDPAEDELRRRVAAEIERRRDTMADEVAALAERGEADQAAIAAVLRRHFEEAYEEALGRYLTARLPHDPRDPQP